MREAFHAGHALVPFRQGLAVDGADAGVAQVVKVAGQRAGDEAAGAGDDDQVVALSWRSMCTSELLFIIGCR